MLTRIQGWKTSLCDCILSQKTLHRLCEEQRENRTRATQGSMCWYMFERKWDLIPAQSFSRALPPYFKFFCLPFKYWEQSGQHSDFPRKAELRFFQQHILTGWGRLRKDLQKYPTEQLFPEVIPKSYFPNPGKGTAFLLTAPTML